MLHFVTVNGQYQPVVRAQPGEALRLRVVHGGNNDHVHVSLVPAAAAAAVTESNDSIEPGQREEVAAEAGGARGAPDASSADDESSGGCKLLTLARDGIYLPAPRLQGGGDGRVVLAPGSRADLAVRCDRPGVYRLVSSNYGATAGGGGGGGEHEDEASIMAYLGKKTDVFEGESQERGGRCGACLSRLAVENAPGCCERDVPFFSILWGGVRLLTGSHLFGGGSYIFFFLPFALKRFAGR